MAESQGVIKSTVKNILVRQKNLWVSAGSGSLPSE
jgi:hypothetical protein